MHPSVNHDIRTHPWLECVDGCSHTEHFDLRAHVVAATKRMRAYAKAKVAIADDFQRIPPHRAVIDYPYANELMVYLPLCEVRTPSYRAHS
jgi:hypothetical protein